MVAALHAAGIEVILDVVYNHTAEGNQLGPTLSMRGMDNAAYYRLSPEDPRYYMDFTGCGNSPNVQHPRMLQLIMDSLRYWVTEMHVDGFRFDLASTLARELCMRSTGWGPFSTLSIRIPSSRRSSSLPSRGMSVRAAIRWAISRSCGANGMASIATPCGASGRAMGGYYQNLPPA